MIFHPIPSRSHGSKKTEAGGGREDKESSSPPPEPVALTKWKTSAVEATSSSQLAVCVNQLERCIAWEKSPMKVVCTCTCTHMLAVKLHVHFDTWTPLY